MFSLSFGVTSGLPSSLSSSLGLRSLQDTLVLPNHTTLPHNTTTHALTHLCGLGGAGRVEDVCGLSPCTTFSSNRLRRLHGTRQQRNSTRQGCEETIVQHCHVECPYVAALGGPACWTPPPSLGTGSMASPLKGRSFFMSTTHTLTLV